MEFDVRFDEEYGCLVSRFVGRFDLDTFQLIMSEEYKLAQDHPCKRILDDFREAKTDFDTFELYDLPKSLPFDSLGRTWKRAVLVSEDSRRNVYFFETVMQNQGYSVRWFTDLDLALKWLNEGE